MSKKILISLLCLFSLYNAHAAIPEANRPAVVFDFGEVVAHVNTPQMLDFLTRSFSINRIELSKAFRGLHAYVAQGGQEKQYWQEYAALKNVTLPDDWIVQYGAIIERSITLIPETVALVHSLQWHGYQTAMLSDVTQYQAEIIRRVGYYDLFYPVLLSFETAVKKPDPAAFENLLQHLQRPASSVIFIDDRPENVASAKNQGIDAILFMNPVQLKEELEQRGVCIDSSELECEEASCCISME